MTGGRCDTAAGAGRRGRSMSRGELAGLVFQVQRGATCSDLEGEGREGGREREEPCRVDEEEEKN